MQSMDIIMCNKMEGLEKLKHTFPVTNWENWLGIFKWKEVQIYSA